jgi:hypothetical protein
VGADAGGAAAAEPNNKSAAATVEAGHEDTKFSLTRTARLIAGTLGYTISTELIPQVRIRYNYL